MAKHLTTRDIQNIVDLIHGWNADKMTWDKLCTAAESIVGKKPTRQSLYTHDEIVSAYTTRKKQYKIDIVRRPKPANISSASDRILKLEKEIETLKERNRLFMQRFIIWQYNAYKRGIKEHELNEPLPQIDRERSDGETR
jgi:hypothetical protein